MLAITLAVAAVTPLGLSACVPAETPDLGAARQEANDFLEDAVDQPGVLATTSGTVGPKAEDAPDEKGITVTFAETVDLDGVDVICFGGGEAVATVQVVSTSGGSSLSIPIPCDGETHEAPLPDGTRGVTEVSVNGWLDRGSVSVLLAVLRGTAP
ncbi:hypothetical protein [Microcella humidisoli]|uniref:Lipoprotein n=1 Tax=Microcella humidisoli TaxID=2963406 RepID=A0ABY5FXM1_9MICO|nr:hypothetical protein [Microcella humidisoli]UTT62884.1 hypothetical protein NNL39_01875 [Microcella humidisoli]